MGDGVDALQCLFQAVAGDDVFDFDELEAIGVVRVPCEDVVCLALVPDGALDVPAGVEEGIDHLHAGAARVSRRAGRSCQTLQDRHSWRGIRLRLLQSSQSVIKQERSVFSAECGRVRSAADSGDGTEELEEEQAGKTCLLREPSLSSWVQAVRTKGGSGRV